MCFSAFPRHGGFSTKVIATELKQLGVRVDALEWHVNNLYVSQQSLQSSHQALQHSTTIISTELEGVKGKVLELLAQKNEDASNQVTQVPILLLVAEHGARLRGAEVQGGTPHARIPRTTQEPVLAAYLKEWWEAKIKRLARKTSPNTFLQKLVEWFQEQK